MLTWGLFEPDKKIRQISDALIDTVQIAYENSTKVYVINCL